MKSKFVTALYDKYGKYVDMLYEYKGHEYFVRRYFSGNAMGEEVWKQHREEQNRIDNLSELHEEPKPYAGPTIDEIFDLMGWN